MFQLRNIDFKLKSGDKKKFMKLGLINLVAFILFVIGYAFMTKNYLDGNICMRIGSFRVVSLVYLIIAILYFAGINLPNIRINMTNLPARIIGALILIPIGFYTEEMLWHSSAFSLESKYVFPNIVIELGVLLVLFLAIQRYSVATSAFMVINVIYGMVNYYVMIYKGYPPLINDLMAYKTATSVMGEYNYSIDDRILRTLLFSLVVILLCSSIKDLERKSYNVYKITGLRIIGTITGVALFVASTFIDVSKICYVNPWNPLDTIQIAGAPLSLFASVQEGRLKKPEGYSADEVQKILDENDSVDDAYQANENVKPTVIVIMNESFSDLRELGDFESDEYMEYWNSIEDYVMRGNVYVSVLGGGTCNSEFEFLTGNSMKYCSNAFPYVQYDLSDAYSIVNVFNENDYETVAFHPYIGANWNREKVYSQFGFESYIDWDSMEADITRISWGTSDSSDYEQIITSFENKTGPMFMFNVTMQNHGGYTGELSDDVEKIKIEEKYKSNIDAVNYLTLIRESDRAFKNLLDYFSAVDEPVVICMFGDHQPALDDDFISKVTDTKDTDVETSEARYITPYIIWSNYDLGVSNVQKDMGLNYLSSNLLHLLSMDTSYSSYLLNLEEAIPVINNVGYQTQDKVWHAASEENVLLDQYKAVQYHEMTGK